MKRKNVKERENKRNSLQKEGRKLDMTQTRATKKLLQRRDTK